MDLRIAVTGLGVTTALGAGRERNWERLCAGETGIAPLRHLDVGDYPVRDGGEDPEPPAAESPDASPALRHLLGVCREALAQAAGDASFGGPPRDPRRLGIAIGSSLAASTAGEAFFRSLLDDGPAAARYELLRGYYAEEHFRTLCAALGWRGPSLLVSNACAAGASSIARAAGWIRAGRCDAALAAGYDPFSVFTFAGFGSLMALSRTEPRPFGAGRDGMKIGGGYAALYLEPLDRARSRGAHPVAVLAGAGESSDAHHLTQPHPDGLGATLAIRRALRQAGIAPEDIDAINCHATSTPANDASEYRAMQAVFGDRLPTIPVCASKPAVGHTLGGAGAVEAVISVLCLAHQQLPPTRVRGEIDPALGPLDLVPEGRPARLRHILSNSFGFGGSNASLVLAAIDAKGSVGGGVDG